MAFSIRTVKCISIQANEYIDFFLYSKGAFMLDTINFIDLVALSRITPEATTERFGGLINSSYFDAANILGALKQKGLVDFITQFPNQSSLTVTDEGKQLLEESHQKSSLPVDKLDMAILTEVSAGMRNLPEIAHGVNVTPRDLAIRLYKLSEQKLLSYELRNGNMNITLTEKGFLQVKDGIPIPVASASAMQDSTTATNVDAQPTAQPQMNAQPSQGTLPPKTAAELKELEAKIMNAKRMKSMALLVILVIAAIAVAFIYITYRI